MLTKVNPKIDLVFKKLFGTEENKDILLSLINAILPHYQQIATLELKNPYNLADYTDGKLTILDIKAQDEKGIQYDIEMQIRGSGFYGKRTLYYWAKIFGSQLDYTPNDNDTNTYIDDKYDGEGGYSELKKCIVISLMDFTFFDDDVCHRCFTLKNRETNQIHKDLDYLDLYFIEMKKFTKDLKLAKTILDRWINFLNNAHRYTNNNLPPQLTEIKEIRKASLKLDAMYLDKKEREYYEGQQKFRLDEISRLKEALEKAEIKAKVQQEKAVEKAEKKINIEIAKKLISKGMENQFIMETTGLSEKQIQKLRSK
jgi:predicted transposase/invertase (TIGR01784 family)